MRQVYDQFPDWETALRAADVTDAELAAVRAKRLAPANEATAAEAPATPAERLAALLPEQLQEAGLSEIERDRLVPRGLGKLPLSRAAVLAHALGGSLGWLAGRVSKPGEPANPQARLSQKALTEARQRSGLREEYLWRRAKLGEAEWWDLMRGVREPTLGQLAKWAGLTSVAVEDLIDA